VTPVIGTAHRRQAHFEPFLDVFGRFEEKHPRRAWHEPESGAHRGFEHLEFATHGAMGPLHYARWSASRAPEELAGFYPVARADYPGER